VLFYEDENTRDFFILLSGKCEVLRSGKRLAIIKASGSCFGDIASILGVKRTATLRALDKTICLKVPQSHFKRFLIEHPDVQLRLLEINLNRLIDINEQFVESQKLLTKLRYNILRIVRNLPDMSSEEISNRLKSMEKLLQINRKKIISE
jgi:CRP-like cAMP-binding protein